MSDNESGWSGRSASASSSTSSVKDIEVPEEVVIYDNLKLMPGPWVPPEVDPAKVKASDGNMKNEKTKADAGFARACLARPSSDVLKETSSTFAVYGNEVKNDQLSSVRTTRKEQMQCAECTLTFTEDWDIVAHFLDVHERRPAKRQRPPSATGHPRKRTRRERTSDNANQDIQRNPTPNDRDRSKLPADIFQCSVCKCSFAKAAALHEHVMKRSHHEEPPK